MTCYGMFGEAAFDVTRGGPCDCEINWIVLAWVRGQGDLSG